MRKRALWFLLLVVSACIPAQTPPILDATPAAGVSVTDDSYRSEAFSLRYPSGWRVITSQAGAPPSVTLVAPGDCALIVVSSTPIEAPPTSSACAEQDIETISRTITLASGEIALAGSAPAAEWEPFLAAFEQVAASISAP
jgi:hypothetical protein